MKARALPPAQSSEKPPLYERLGQPPPPPQKAPALTNLSEAPSAAKRTVKAKARRFLVKPNYEHDWSQLCSQVDVSSLTESELRFLRDIVRQHFDVTGIGIGSGIKKANVLQDYKKYGYSLNPVQEALLAQNLALIKEFGLDYRGLLRELRQPPMSATVRLAIQQVKDTTAIRLQRICSDYGTQAHFMSESTARHVLGMITSFMEGRLAQTRWHSLGGARLTTEEYLDLQTDSPATIRQQLCSELYHFYKKDPENRGTDWSRFADTEIDTAINTARLLEVSGDYSHVYFSVNIGACQRCKRAYLDGAGRPLKLELRPLLARATTSAGIDVTADGGPNALMHPSCSCVPVPWIEGIGPITPS